MTPLESMSIAVLVRVIMAALGELAIALEDGRLDPGEALDVARAAVGGLLGAHDER